MTDRAGRLPGWLLDERASAGRENLDAGHVARYDAKQDSGARAEVELLRRLGMGEDSTVLDLGAGTGQFTMAAAPFCGRVIAVDVSPVMREVLDHKVRASGRTNVSCVSAGFLTYEHEGPPVDVAYSNLALHHIPDFWKAQALTRLTAVLRPGAVFRLVDVVFHFEPGETAERIEAWCAGADRPGGDVESEWLRHEYEEHVRDEHSTYTWILEPLIERSGLVVEEASYSEDGIFARYVLRRP